jgi:hypothetical protein
MMMVGMKYIRTIVEKATRRAVPARKAKMRLSLLRPDPLARKIFNLGRFVPADVIRLINDLVRRGRPYDRTRCAIQEVTARYSPLA